MSYNECPEEYEGYECPAADCPNERLVMREYSQGVCQDGAAILCNGEQMTVDEILDHLRRGSGDEADARRYRKLRTKHWSDGGIAIVQDAKNIQLGAQCLSLSMLDSALDLEA